MTEAEILKRSDDCVYLGKLLKAHIVAIGGVKLNADLDWHDSTRVVFKALRDKYDAYAIEIERLYERVAARAGETLMLDPIRYLGRVYPQLSQQNLRNELPVVVSEALKRLTKRGEFSLGMALRFKQLLKAQLADPLEVQCLKALDLVSRLLDHEIVQSMLQAESRWWADADETIREALVQLQEAVRQHSALCERLPMIQYALSHVPLWSFYQAGLVDVTTAQIRDLITELHDRPDVLTELRKITLIRLSYKARRTYSHFAPWLMVWSTAELGSAKMRLLLTSSDIALLNGIKVESQYLIERPVPVQKPMLLQALSFDLIVRLIKLPFWWVARLNRSVRH